MRTKLFTLISLHLLAAQVSAVPGGWYHAEPLMSEGLSAITQINQTKVSPELTCDEGPPGGILNYISKEPKTEKWRSYYKLPKLLNENLYQIKDVCAEAKRMNAAQGVDRKYALVAHKGHLCDTNHRACLSMMKSVSDPCNYFVKDNFQVFHSRTFFKNKSILAGEKVRETYGKVEPAMVVIRLSDCKLVPTAAATKAMKAGMSQEKAVLEDHFRVPPSDGNDSTGSPKFRSADEAVRFEAMKNELVTKLPELASLNTARTHCISQGKRSLPGILDSDKVDYGQFKDISAIAAMRKLLDEQMVETGYNPFP